MGFLQSSHEVSVGAQAQTAPILPRSLDLGDQNVSHAWPAESLIKHCTPHTSMGLLGSASGKWS